MVRTIRNALIPITGARSNVISETKSTSKRVVLEVSNLNAIGGNDIFLSIDSEAAVNMGRRVQAGQTVTWSTDGGYIPPQGRVTAYCAGNANISVYEEVEV